MTLSHEQLLSIGEKAAHQVIGNVETVEVTTGTNEDGRPSYYFELHLNQSEDRAQATRLRTRLRQKIRDLLIAENDGKYPYVRIVGDPR